MASLNSCMCRGPGVVVGIGFSGSGFKHSPASGRILASLAMGVEETGFQLERYRLKRFC